MYHYLFVIFKAVYITVSDKNKQKSVFEQVHTIQSHLVIQICIGKRVGYFISRHWTLTLQDV